ncbi:HAMP domain-containing histidine kinase [Streptomyces sp. TM32]|uniref:sensor histidine kinase n=1 Tax=Streptomyces sp. TM32 TaxID=1652669 RepID=UPI00101352B2|nr:HAMP domain-containing sensor histidine kinase [Streptomyces sp. TM32]RXS69105.1 HAMP domain-containing histidine kinase [Streptomyces sp. TM32]
MAGAWRDSLRARLMVGVVLLAALGMVVVNVASLVGLRTYLVDVADANLTKARTTVQHRAMGRRLRVSGAMLHSLVPGGTYVALLDGHGRVVAQTPEKGLNGRPAPRPDLPVPVPHGFAEHPVTLKTTGTPLPRYRTLAFPVGPHATVQPHPGVPPEPFGTVVIADSLAPTDDVVYWLIGADATATLAVLGGIVLLSRGVLRVGLRPLREMAATATAIAGGNVDQRIETAGRPSEVGEVATALNRAFDERQRSEERLRRFVADASHELRTPLTTIRGWAQLHLHGLARDPELVERAMLRIEDEAGRMHSMVEELLLLARLDQGRPLTAAPVDLGRLVRDAVADARALEPGRPITVEEQGEACAHGDEDRLLQVLRNLLDNALRYTPPGTPTSVRVRAPDGAHVELRVTDQGPGMDPDTAGRIFERFYRGDASRTPGSGGTGLGLSIVKSIAEAHGGTVTVHTTPGEGSTFTVTLPACLPLAG